MSTIEGTDAGGRTRSLLLSNVLFSYLEYVLLPVHSVFSFLFAKKKNFVCYYSPPHARTSRMFSYSVESVLLINKMCSPTGAEEDPSASASPASRSLGVLCLSPPYTTAYCNIL